MDFKDKDWQVNRVMDQLAKLALTIDKCLNCGATDLNVDEDIDMITCISCGSTWESFDSYFDEKSDIPSNNGKEAS